MQAFDVFLNGKLIDTIFATGYTVEEMRRSLIDHDNYHVGIVVRLCKRQTRKHKGE